MLQAVQNTYTVSGPKGLPVLGMILAVKNDPLGFVLQNALHYGDVVPCRLFGKKLVQINHPDLIHQVLVENHKNYHKSVGYKRFEPSIGQALLTSNGEKWRRNRQRIQPMFRRDTVERYYFDVVNEVGEKFKHRWLALTEKGKARLDISQEMSDITIEIILRLVFGKDNLDQDTVTWLHRSFDIAIDYHKNLRLIPAVHLQKIFQTPPYRRYARELARVEALLKTMSERYRRGENTDKDNMLAQLIDAHKNDPEHFTERDVRDQTLGMIFAGFETTSILMQWLWYVLDEWPDATQKVRAEVTQRAPCTLDKDSMGLTFDAINGMHYLAMVMKETMRLYPPLWAISQQPVADDHFGDFKVARGTEVVLPQLVLHRHPRWWDDPNAFIPERFSPENEAKIRPGLYFPFSLGPRGCIGQRLAEIEAKVVFAKLLPFFKATAVNAAGNSLAPRISLKLKYPLIVEISRI